MRTAVDTNVVSAILSNERGSDRVADTLAEAQSVGGLVISAPVYAELMAHPNATEDVLAKFLRAAPIAVDYALDESIWREAGRKFAAYAKRRREARSGSPKRLLIDFVVAAHAKQRADRLFTLDSSRYTQDFPSLLLLSLPQ